MLTLNGGDFAKAKSRWSLQEHDDWFSDGLIDDVSLRESLFIQDGDRQPYRELTAHENGLVFISFEKLVSINTTKTLQYIIDLHGRLVESG